MLQGYIGSIATQTNHADVLAHISRPEEDSLGLEGSLLELIVLSSLLIILQLTAVLILAANIHHSTCHLI